MRISYPVPVDPTEVPHYIGPDPSWIPPNAPQHHRDLWLDPKLVEEDPTRERRDWGTAVQITAIICMTLLMIVAILVLLAPR
jgi:hypothetical protein